MDVDTTLGAWPGHSSSSAEPRQALGARVWGWKDSLRTSVLEVLMSVRPTEDSCTPQRLRCAIMATYSVSKALWLNRVAGRLQRHLLYPALGGLGPSQLDVGESDTCHQDSSGFSSAVPLMCSPYP